MAINSFLESRAMLLSGEISCEELTRYFLAKISDSTDLNIFLESFDDSALAKAREVDQKIKEKKAGKLAGMVVSIKDNICYKNHHISASSRILEGFESLYSSTVVERLLKEDAVIIGRTNCDEFAMGSSNENSYYGEVKNPLAKEKTPGGSSGGASASVAAGLCHLALGSDTGGSIRQPASFTGTIGLKPTYGRVSRHGLIAYASSFDQIGPIGKSIEDIALVLEVIAGRDEYDSTCSQSEVEQYSRSFKESYGKAKIAYLDCHFDQEGIDEEVKEKSLAFLRTAEKMGHKVERKTFNFMEQLVPAYQVITTAECSSNLARYDGIHFGYRSEAATDLYTTYAKSRTEGFGKEVKRRIMLGTYVLSEGYYDAYFGNAQKVRRLVKQKTEEILGDCDFIFSPTTPHSAFALGSQKDDPIKMYLEDIFTVQANLSGNPAISFPLAESKNLPFGFQLIGKSFAEGDLLRFSRDLINTEELKKAVV